MRTQQCRDKIHKTAELCGLSHETVAEIDSVTGFVEEHPSICGLTTDAIKPLMKIPDDDKRQEAISHVEKTLNRKTPTGGIIKKRLTKPEVEKIIEKVLPSEKPKTETCVISPAISEVKPQNVSIQLPPPRPPTPVPATHKTVERVRKEKAEQLDRAVNAMLDLMPSTRFRSIIDEKREQSPGEFKTSAEVITRALDFFAEKWKS